MRKNGLFDSTVPIAGQGKIREIRRQLYRSLPRRKKKEREIPRKPFSRRVPSLPRGGGKRRVAMLHYHVLPLRVKRKAEEKKNRGTTWICQILKFILMNK